MTWDELRDACLAQPGAEETFPFDEGIARCSRRRTARCSRSAPSATTRSRSASRSTRTREWRCAARYDAVREGYHLNKRHWVTLTLGRDLPDDLVVGLVETSYELVTTRRRARR